ncbi:peptidoglycan-binding protein LysM [Ruegeria sp.]|uniref:peptidoglycan-binding protein LysM n=1 Tax=Ruegeria sp. TaxID=1879320 RepID=UPI0023136535|nr:peptidoglycan-binding protein LysM [Ruegeria sp.]MDA7965152.1 peptidoglycan-binding protein LysM [Ruegeria sp.]
MFEFNLKKVAMTATAATALSAGAAAAQEACTNYTVSDGDTMASIAVAAYGTSNYQPIFNANRNVITNPNALSPGLVLALPCDDGSLPNGQSAQEIIAAEEQRAAGTKRSNVYEPPIKIVVGGGWAPFATEDMTDGGMLPRLAATALNRAGNQRDYSISWVDDWGSHLSTLLPLGAFDVSLGWSHPDCSDRSYEWSDDTTLRCTQFDSTVSSYDVVFGFFSLPENDYANASSYEDMSGSTICRMDGWLNYDFEEAGLVDGENFTRLSPRTSQECIDAVLTGVADLASFEVQAVSQTMADMGLSSNDIVENPFVNYVVSYRFFAHRSNPFGRQYLSMLNKGLNEMRESGEWYAIVSDSLREHNENTLAASN